MKTKKLLVLMLLLASFFVNRVIWAVPSPPVINSPVFAQTYLDTLFLSYIIPSSPAAGSITVAFTPMEGPEIVLTMSDATNVACTLDLSNVMAECPSVVTTNSSSIPDGNYRVTVSYYENGTEDRGESMVDIVIDSNGGGDELPTFDVYAPESDSTLSIGDSVTVSYLLPVDSNCSSVVFIIGSGESYYFFPLETTEGEIETTVNLADQSVPAGSDYMAVVQCLDGENQTLATSTVITNLTVADATEESGETESGEGDTAEDGSDDGEDNSDDGTDGTGGGTQIDTGALNLNATCQLNRAGNANFSTMFVYLFMFLTFPAIIKVVKNDTP